MLIWQKVGEKILKLMVGQNACDMSFKQNDQAVTQHSTETALIKIQHDILVSLDNSKGVLLILLDISAAFDTIDHNILLTRLESRIGVTGTAL